MSAETASGADFETRLALVCEDAPERQGVIKAALDQIGFAMLSVRNSDEAIERLRRDVYEIQEVGEPFGMMTFDQSLLRSYEHGIVTEDTAENYSTRKAVVQRGIDTVKQTRGEKTTDVEGLKLDHDYNRSVFGARKK